VRLVILLALAGLSLAACTTTATRAVAPTELSKPAANAKVVLVQPDVELSILNASGVTEARADWSRAAREQLATTIRTSLSSKALQVEELDPEASMGGRTGQLLRLHERVGLSVIAHEYLNLKLPSKEGRFDWTLGDGAAELGKAKGADYALFVTARGTYASDARKALMVGAALIGVGIPLGHQEVYASLVELKTGKVVWFNVASAGPSADMRSAEGATSLTTDLLKGAPL
jgi:hypothetical protein